MLNLKEYQSKKMEKSGWLHSECILFGDTTKRTETDLTFHPDEEIFVHLHSEKSTGAAVILSEKITQESHRYFGRYPIRYHDKGTICHVRPHRIFPVFRQNSRPSEASPVSHQPRIVVCAETKEYRLLARTQVKNGDKVLEIGCSYGEATHILGQQTPFVTGVDISEETIQACRKRFPGMDFEKTNCFVDSSRLRELLREKTLVFIDIGGNRNLVDLLKLIPFVFTHLPDGLLLIKNRALFQCLSEYHDNLAQSLPETEPVMPQIMRFSIPLGIWKVLEENYPTKPQKSAFLNQPPAKSGSCIGKLFHPLCYPRNSVSIDGAPPQIICRFHNYRPRIGCLLASSCLFNHDYCNQCLHAGHIALECRQAALSSENVEG
eukprot:Sdes_comp19125_c0_seq1m9839